MEFIWPKEVDEDPIKIELDEYETVAIQLVYMDSYMRLLSQRGRVVFDETHSTMVH